MYLDYDTYFEYHDQTYIIIEKVANYYGIEQRVKMETLQRLYD